MTNPVTFVASALDAGAPGAAAAIGGVSVVALVLLSVAVAGAGGAPGRAARGPDRRGDEDHHDRRHDGAHQWPGLHPVLVYPRYPARSACNGACAQYWPPVTARRRPAAGPGVTGRLGAITRSDGSTQATYGRHPLYTYVADTGPGQTNGNNLNLNGSLWREVTMTR
jgi:predicted lipoprotein with Yx(FWY)xxD motif